MVTMIRNGDRKKNVGLNWNFVYCHSFVWSGRHINGYRFKSSYNFSLWHLFYNHLSYFVGYFSYDVFWEDKGVCLIVMGKGLGNNVFSVTGFIEFQRGMVNMYLISDQKFYVSSCYVMLDGSLLHRHPIFFAWGHHSQSYTLYQ